MLDVRQPDIVRPAVGAGLNMMRAAMIPAIVHAPASNKWFRVDRSLRE